MHVEAFEWLDSVVKRSGQPTSVVEFGARNINGSVRWLVHDAVYVGVDIAPGDAVDVVCDAADYTPDFVPDMVISAETLEHAERAETVVKNAFAIVKPGGSVVLTCAGPRRDPHSGVDGGPLPPGEWYRGISVDEIVRWVSECGGEVVEAQDHPRRGDVYVWARSKA